MCNFISRDERVIAQHRGLQRQYEGCFLEHATQPEQDAWGSASSCEFHEKGPAIRLARSGTGTAAKFEARLSRYMLGQKDRYTELDLVGLTIRYHNGTGPFQILCGFEEGGPSFGAILLDEAELYCPTSIVDIADPDIVISLKRANLHGEVKIKNVTCRDLVLSDTIFHQDGLEIANLTCDRLDLSRSSVNKLRITNCQIGTLCLSDAAIRSLEIHASAIGRSTGLAPYDAPDGLLFFSLADGVAPMKDISLLSCTLRGRVDLRNRSLSGTLRIEDSTLHAPPELSRGGIGGFVTLSGNIYTHSTSNGEAASLWVRFFAELKSEGLKSGDSHLLRHAAIWEQEAQLRLNPDTFHQMIFFLDGAISQHGTDLARPTICMVLQTAFFIGIYTIIDALTGRWHVYKSLFDMVGAKTAFSVSQTVRPFSAFEKDFMGHPYLARSSEDWLDFVTLAVAGLQSVVCIVIIASAVLALRHRISSKE